MKKFFKIVFYVVFFSIFLAVGVYSAFDDMFISKQEIEDGVYSRQTYQYGSYYAEVNYSNKCTGFKNFYQLNVDVEGDSITRINFNNGGYIDLNNIISGVMKKGENAIVKNKDGCSEYEIKIISEN